MGYVIFSFDYDLHLDQGSRPHTPVVRESGEPVRGEMTVLVCVQADPVGGCSADNLLEHVGV